MQLIGKMIVSILPISIHQNLIFRKQKIGLGLQSSQNEETGELCLKVPFFLHMLRYFVSLSVKDWVMKQNKCSLYAGCNCSLKCQMQFIIRNRRLKLHL